MERATTFLHVVRRVKRLGLLNRWCSVLEQESLHLQLTRRVRAAATRGYIAKTSVALAAGDRSPTGI